MSEIDEIKARLDIVDVVQGYVPLKRAGRNYKGLCPFHTEKTPSFVVFPDTQTWRCFGACSEGGDLFNFFMKIEGLDFGDALKVLAERAGVELKPRSPETAQQQEDFERLQALLGQAADFYTGLLFESPQAESVRKYVAQRGLADETVRTFGLGYAPDAWQATLDHFVELGYSTEDLLEAGLIIESESGRPYDRFRHRLMIPIRDGRGRVVGFGARALSDDQVPKYLNSPQGPLFDKSRLLYGMDLARREIRETETVVVVEGYMDVIQAYQAGYRNVVAQMGTALTNTQAQMLAKLANRLILALDSDSAGTQATMRGLNVVHESLVDDGEETEVTFDARGMVSLSGQLKLDTRILSLPQGKDPDDFIRLDPDAWPQAVSDAVPLADYVIDIGTRGMTDRTDIYERERVAQSLLPLLTATENDLFRNQNIQRLAMRLHIPERDLLAWAQREQPASQPQRLVKHKDKRPTSNARSKSAASSTSKQTAAGVQRSAINRRAQSLERYCLSLLLQEPLWVFVADRKFRQLALTVDSDPVAMRALGSFGEHDFTRSDYQALLQLIRRASEQDAIEPPLYIQQNLSPELESLVEEVLPEPIERFHDRTSAMHRKVLRNVLKEQKLHGNERELETAEFVRSVLELRMERIEREISELYFLDQDQRLAEDDEIPGVDYQMIRGLTRARNTLLKAIRDLR